MPDATEASNPAKDALSQTADFVRLSSGLVTGILGASFVFFSGTGTTDGSRPWLFCAWIAMLLSALASLVVYALIPPKFADKDYSLHDTWLNVAGLAHLGLFVLGLLLLTVGCAVAAFQRDSVPTAQDALDRARDTVRANHAGAVRIELIKGTGAFGTTANTWHIEASTPSVHGKGTLKSIDIYIDTRSGRITRY